MKHTHRGSKISGFCGKAILASMLVVATAQAEEGFVPGQNVTLLKLSSSDNAYHLTLGLGVLDSKVNNIGYVAYEYQGGLSGDAGIEMQRLAIKGEAFNDPMQPYESWVQGMKFDLFVADTQVGGYQWQGAGVGLGLVFSPFSESVPLSLTLGGELSPAFTQFKGTSNAHYQWTSSQELEFFLSDGFGVMIRHTRLSTGNNLVLSPLDDRTWLGLRLMF